MYIFQHDRCRILQKISVYFDSYGGENAREEFIFIEVNLYKNVEGYHFQTSCLQDKITYFYTQVIIFLCLYHVYIK